MAADAHPLAGYLTRAILDPLPQEWQTVTLKTAYLPRFTADTVRRLTGSQEAETILEHHYRHSNFTFKHPGSTPGYEHHELFRRVLRSAAERRISLEQRHELALTAADILLGEDATDEALNLLFDHALWEVAAERLLEIAPVYMERGALHTVADWLRRLPAAIVETSAWLSHWLGASHSPAEPGTGRACLERAYALFRESGEAEGLYRAWSAIVECLVLSWEDFSQLDRWIDEGDWLRANFPDPPTLTCHALFTANWFAALAHRNLLHPGFAEARAGLEALIGQTPEVATRIRHAAALWIYVSTIIGDSEATSRLFKQLQPAASHALLDPVAEVFWHYQASDFALLSGDAWLSLQLSQFALQRARKLEIRYFEFMIAAQIVYAAVALQDEVTAEAFLIEASLLLRPERKMDQAHYGLLAFAVSASSGRSEQALAEIQAGLALGRQYGALHWEAFGQVGEILGLIETADLTQARELCPKLMETAERIDSDIFRFQGLLCSAMAAFASDAEDDGKRFLRAALVLGRSKRLPYFTAWLPKAMSRLLSRAVEYGIEPAYAEEFIARHQLWPIRIRTLGEFRVQILRGREWQELALAGKELALLHLLLADGETRRERDLLIQTLWPGSPEKAGLKAFEQLLNRLRDHLEIKGAVKRHAPFVSLNRGLCRVDSVLFRDLVRWTFQTIRPGKIDPDLARAGMQRFFAAYPGPFLPSVSGHPAVAATRAALRSTFLRTINHLAQYWETVERPDLVIDCYEQALTRHGAVDDLYLRLIKVLCGLDRRLEALQVYLRYIDMLQRGGIVVSMEIQRLRDDIASGR